MYAQIVDEQSGASLNVPCVRYLGRFAFISPSEARGKPCTGSKRYEEALALTARETGKVGHHGWALATVRARSNPKQNSYTALRGMSSEWAVVVPSRLIPASEALTE
jgi:hypothetical protein